MKTPIDDMNHNPACAYWDIGSCCNCGAIDKAKGPSHSDILEKRKQDIIQTTARMIYDTLSNDLMDQIGENPLSIFAEDHIREVLETSLFPYQIVQHR